MNSTKIEEKEPEGLCRNVTYFVCYENMNNEREKT